MAILCNNSFDNFVSYLDILKIGAISVPLYSADSTRKISYIVNTCEEKALLSNKKLGEAALAVFPTAKTMRLPVVDQDELPGWNHS